MKRLLTLLIVGMISATIISADKWNDMRHVNSKINKDSKSEAEQEKKEDRFKKEETNTTKLEKPKERKPLW